MRTDDVNSPASAASHPSDREKRATGMESRQRRDSPHESTVRAVRHETLEPNPRQAAQLTEYLQQRIQELDRREANFYAQVASWEQECRHWRNTVEQREEKLNARQQQLAVEEETSQRQAAALAMDQVSWEQEITERKESDQEQGEILVQLEARLQGQQEQLDHERQQLGEEQVRWALQYQEERRQWQQMHEQLDVEKEQRQIIARQQQEATQLADMAHGLEHRQQRIETLESILEEDAGQFAETQEQYRREREQWLVETARAHEQWRQQQERQQRELQLAWEELGRRQQEIGHRETGLRNSQQQLVKLQEQVLDMQAALEQLCSQAEQETPGLQMPGWFQHIRERLQQYHRVIGDEVIECQEQLQQASRQLAERQEGLTAQHRRLSRWARHEQQRLDASLADMALRESELAELRHQYQQQKTAWIERRRQQQRRLRKLLAA